jgi:hypothetical protein
MASVPGPAPSTSPKSCRYQRNVALPSMVQAQRNVQVLQQAVGQHGRENSNLATLLHGARARIRGAVKLVVFGLQLELPIARALRSSVVGDEGMRRPGEG